MSESPATYASAISAGQAPAEPGATLSEQAPTGAINLRGEPDDDGFTAAVKNAIGVSLPTAPNTVAASETARALWLGPNEWLILTALDAQADVQRRLSDGLGSVFAAVTDVSGYYTPLTVAGAGARDLLARGCPLDLHPRRFAPGQCAQTVLAKASVILEPLDATPRFRILVRRSFADYLWRWLHDARRTLD